MESIIDILFDQSPSSRRAWIEIRCPRCSPPAGRVALLAEGVDRNLVVLLHRLHDREVALLAEGVDRNPTAENIYRQIQVVALLAEGVDRNTPSLAAPTDIPKSPSSRRAWIEMDFEPTTMGKLVGRPPRGGRG